MSSSLKSKIVGSILLVAGTQIGAGMLALPIKTGVSGFVPAVILFSLIFVYMLLNIFVLLEATLYCKSDKANIISIVKSQLGKGSQIIAWFSFLSSTSIGFSHSFYFLNASSLCFRSSL